MSGSERRKGRTGEAELRAVLDSHGFRAEGLQRNLVAVLDVLAHGYGVRLAVEGKRCNALRVPEWTRQAQEGAPDGYLPVVAYRRDREPWYAVAPLDGLLTALAQLGRDNANLESRLDAATLEVRKLRELASRYEDAANTWLRPPLPGQSGPV